MTTKAEQQQSIEAFAAQTARKLAQDRALITGFGAETVLENALLAMAVHAVGAATNQPRLAQSILAEAEKEAA